MMTTFKLGSQIDGTWVTHAYPRTYDLQSERAKPRLVIGVASGDPRIFRQLLTCLESPCFLLYVLHTPRGEGAPGRYQTPALPIEDIVAFVERFSAYLSGDGRFDLWVHSPSTQATLVWDRHDLLYGYGPIARFIDILREIGYTAGSVEVPSPHEHYYRSEFDASAREVMAAHEWTHSSLQPEDAQ